MKDVGGQIGEFHEKLAAILKDVQSLQHSLNAGAKTVRLHVARRYVSGSLHATVTTNKIISARRSIVEHYRSYSGGMLSPSVFCFVHTRVKPSLIRHSIQIQ